MNDLLKWCRDQRVIMLDDIKSFESGNWRMVEVRQDGYQVDATTHWVAMMKKRVAELDKLINSTSVTS